MIYEGLHEQMPEAFERNFGVASRNLIRIANAQGINGDAELKRVTDGLNGQAAGA